MEISDVNKALQALDVVEPLITFEEPVKLQPKHYEALAKMYADEGYRDLLKVLFNNALKSAALRSTDAVDSVFGKAQALTFKKLLIDAKNAYEYVEKLRLKRNKDAQAKSEKGHEGV